MTNLPLVTARPPKTALAMLACLAVLTPRATAQPVLGSSPIGDQSGAGKPAPNASMARRSPLLAAAGAPSATAPLRWGPFELRPHLHYTYTEADGLRSARAGTSDTAIQTAAVGLVVNIGDQWTADYTASSIEYSSDDFRDSVSHHLSVNGRVLRANWVGIFSQRYSATDTTLIETGRQTKRQTADTTGIATWELGPQLTASVLGNQALTFVEALPDTCMWTLQPTVEYLVAQAVTIGVSAAAGYVLRYNSSDMEFVRPSATASWQVTRKTSLSVQAGRDYWRFVSGERNTTGGAFYSATLAYEPFTMTQISVTADRGISPATFRDQATENEGWTVALRQRLLQRFNLRVGVGQQRSRYLAATLGLPITRRDNVKTLDVELSTTFRQRGTITAFYRENKNTSTLAAFAFSTRQFGVEVGYKF